MPSGKNVTYRKWIREHPCHICGKWSGVADNGKPISTPAHVRTFGASGQDLNNIVPLCVNCHQDQEVWPIEKKMSLESAARRYTQEYYDDQRSN